MAYVNTQRGSDPEIEPPWSSAEEELLLAVERSIRWLWQVDRMRDRLTAFEDAPQHDVELAYLNTVASEVLRGE